jgi:hypothetical protein
MGKLRPCRSLERRGCLFANLTIYVAVLIRLALAPLRFAPCLSASSNLECLKPQVHRWRDDRLLVVSFSN